MTSEEKENVLCRICKGRFVLSEIEVGVCSGTDEEKN